MRAYTREFRESAVGLVLLEGVSIHNVADDLRMPYHTLHGWVRAARRPRRKPVQKVQPRTKADAEARVRELEAEVRKLRLERDTLESGGVLRAGAAVKYAFIRDELAVASARKKR